MSVIGKYLFPNTAFTTAVLKIYIEIPKYLNMGGNFNTNTFLFIGKSKNVMALFFVERKTDDSLLIFKLGN